MARPIELLLLPPKEDLIRIIRKAIKEKIKEGDKKKAQEYYLVGAAAPRSTKILASFNKDNVLLIRTRNYQHAYIIALYYLNNYTGYYTAFIINPLLKIKLYYNYLLKEPKNQKAILKYSYN